MRGKERDHHRRPTCSAWGKVWKLVARALRLAGKPLEWVLMGMIRVYQLAISPLLPKTCRFYPSCSQYMIEAIRQRGPLIGLVKGIWRIMRCNPFCEGGYDPVQPPESNEGPPPGGEDADETSPSHRNR